MTFEEKIYNPYSFAGLIDWLEGWVEDREIVFFNIKETDENKIQIKRI